MLPDSEKSIRATKRKVISELKKIFEPHMWESGYRIGPIGKSRPMKLWAPKDADGSPTMVVFDGPALTQFWGISEEGIITDAYGGACVTEPLPCFSMEDLLILHKWAIKQPSLVAQTTRKLKASR